MTEHAGAVGLSGTGRRVGERATGPARSGAVR